MYSVFKEFPKGWGVKKIPRKWKILGGGGVLCEIPSVVGVWIFSGTTHCFEILSIDCSIQHFGNRGSAQFRVDETKSMHFSLFV